MIFTVVAVALMLAVAGRDLTARLEDDDPIRRSEAAAALFALAAQEGPQVDAVGPLRSLLERERVPFVKASAALALGAMQDPRAVPSLTPLLVDAHVDVRRAAIAALGAVAHPDAARPLWDRLAREPHPDLQVEIVHALGRLRALDALEALHRTTSAPDLRAVIDQERDAVRGIVDQDEHRRALERAAVAAAGPSADAQSVPWSVLFYDALASCGSVVEPAAMLVAWLPMVVLFAVGARGAPGREKLRRLATLGAVAIVLALVGGMASVPGLSRGLVRGGHMPPQYMLLSPFAGAFAALPFAGSAALLGRPGRAVAQAIGWGVASFAIQFGTWSIVPFVLRGHYFNYGAHEGVGTTMLGHAVGVVAASYVARLLVARDGSGWRFDALTGPALRRVVVVTLAVVAMARMTTHLYAY